jgi:hypothetical protein
MGSPDAASFVRNAAGTWRMAVVPRSAFRDEMEAFARTIASRGLDVSWSGRASVIHVNSVAMRAAREECVDYLERFPPLDLDHTRVLRWLSEHGGIPQVTRPDGMPVELPPDGAD